MVEYDEPMCVVKNIMTMGDSLKKDKSKKKKLNTFVFFFVLALIIYNCVSAYMVMIRTVRAVAQSQMEDVANKAIHYAIAEVSEEFDYGSVVRIERGSDGAIQSLSLDTAVSNKIKSEIAIKVMNYLNNSDNYDISVPIGNFCGSEFLSGIGPGVKFRIVPFNIARIDFESKFSSAGINQVLHTLSVRVDVEIGALLPGFEEISNLTSSAVVAQTVVMGDVPETYLNIQK